jgi:hypothetical protein
MATKRILCADRLRRVPKQFSWVDQRLVRDKHICGLSNESRALYLFLVIVSDAEGLSYYSDAAVERYLSLHPVITAQSRAQLCAAGLIAYRHPLYQVLSLDMVDEVVPTLFGERPRVRGRSEAMSLGDILRQAQQGGVR